MIELFTQLVQGVGELNTVLLLIALLVIFVIAFKVLEMVMQTLIVSGLSGGFYLAISYYFSSVQFSVESLLFFTLIGGSLYTGYNLITTSASLMTKAIKIPVKMTRKLIEVLKDLSRDESSS